MTAVQLFLIAWHALSLQTCIAYTGGYAGISGVVPHVIVPTPFFGGPCTEAIVYAKQLGGWWSYA